MEQLTETVSQSEKRKKKFECNKKLSELEKKFEEHNNEDRATEKKER